MVLGFTAYLRAIFYIVTLSTNIGFFREYFKLFFNFVAKQIKTHPTPMQTLNQWITASNDYLWSYILIALLLGCALWFTLRSGFVQFRMVGEMFRLLGEKPNSKKSSKKSISSFGAFSISLASRVGTGNLAGVATAIVVGGPGAVFWMWVIALLGAANAFIESTLAQAYKRKDKDSYIGGPAYYMERGLGKRWMGVIFAVLITLTFGFAFNTVQSNTICASFGESFGTSSTVMGVVLSVLTLVIIFGGVHRIARISSVIVPFMALGYILLALVVVAMNITELPEVISLIFKSAFGWEQAAGGAMGAALMQGIRRGLFSNEAGMGSAPNAAATAEVSHPVKQGLIQTLGVFVDTLFICSCTAFIILFSGVELDGTANGINLTQAALTAEIGSGGGIFVAVALFLFAFSSILGNYYYGESNIRFITRSPLVLLIYRLAVGAMVFFGAITSLEMAWNLADLTMGLMTICNLIAIILLGRHAIILLNNYRHQRGMGIKNPRYQKEATPELKDKIDLW